MNCSQNLSTHKICNFAIKFLCKEYKWKLNGVDNKLENYFDNTLNKYIKKIFRTKQGLFNFIKKGL